ncbi:MAG TPA: hypothetical protein VF299_03780 [Mycobacterium sp.]
MPHPISPEQARTEVIDAARDIATALNGEVAEALFSYDSCNDEGEPPFRGALLLKLWLPGIPHDEPADPQRVLQVLAQHGWSSDPNLHSHAPALRRGPIIIMITVAPRAPAGKKIGAHVGVNVDGQCRDTFDHRTDGSILPVDVRKEIAQP